MYNIFNILNFCHNVVTKYKYKFACISLQITTYTNTQVVFIQFSQVSNELVFIFSVMLLIYCLQV